MKPALIIMAAGMGSRYGGLKQIDPLGPNGECLLEYSMYDAIRAGFGKVVFVIRRDFETEFKEQIGRRFEDQIVVQYAFQSIDDLPAGFSVPAGRTKPWGTGQAVLACKRFIHEPFVVQNADDFYGAEAYQVIAEALKTLPLNESCMVGYRLSNTLSAHGSVSRGICETVDGKLSTVTERLSIAANESRIIQYIENGNAVNMTGDEICSMNFWGFQPSLFDTLEEKFIAFLKEKGQELKSEWYIPNIIQQAIDTGETCVNVLSSNSRWFGVTYPEDRASVVASLKKMHDDGTYPPKL